MTTAGGRITAGVGANLIGQHSQDRNQEATCYVGNLDEQVSDELLWELFTQAGPVNQIYVPKDRVTNKHKGHAFVEFTGEEDADYAIKVLNMIKVYGKPIRVNKASHEKKALDVGANLFIGNLDPDLDEKMLYDTFSAFGVIVATPKIMRDPDSGISKGYGFVSFDNFESSDAAIDAMNGQFLMNRSISAQYAFKKDTNERHGTPEERLMAQNNRMVAVNAHRPHTMFAAAPSGNVPVQADGVAHHPPPLPPQGIAPPQPGMPMPGMPPVPPAAPMMGMPPPSGLLTLPIPSAAPQASSAPLWAMPGGAAPPPPWLQRPPAYPGMPMHPPPMVAPPPVPGQYSTPGMGGFPPPPLAAPPAPPVPNPPPAPYPQQV